MPGKPLYNKHHCQTLHLVLCGGPGSLFMREWVLTIVLISWFVHAWSAGGLVLEAAWLQYYYSYTVQYLWSDGINDGQLTSSLNRQLLNFRTVCLYLSSELECIQTLQVGSCATVPISIICSHWLASYAALQHDWSGNVVKTTSFPYLVACSNKKIIVHSAWLVRAHLDCKQRLEFKRLGQ